MKTINKYLLILTSVVFAFTACKSEIERDPSPEVGNNVAAFEKSALVVDINPMRSALEYPISIVRSNTDAELIVNLNVVEGDDNIINVPSSASFAKGEDKTEILLTFPNALLDSTYNIVIAIEDKQQSPYLDGAAQLDFTVNIATWENAETKAIIVDGIIDAAYGTGQQMWYVDYQIKLNSDGSTDYRILNPYSTFEESPQADAFGIYNVYPYNEEGDVDIENDYPMVIHVNADGTAIYTPFDMGCAWDGAFSSMLIADFYAQKNNTDPDYATYGAGQFDATTNSILFPDGVLLLYIEGYGGYPNENALIIYLDAEAYKNDHLTVDYNSEDIEWIEQETVVNIFESTIFNFTNEEQKLYKAVNPLEDNPKSPYIDLYCLKNAYAKGGNLSFYWDGEDGDIDVPVPQNTKLSFMQQELLIVEAYAEALTDKVKGVDVTTITFDIVVASQTGNYVGEFIETFSFSKEDIIYGKADYIGSFNLNGYNQFDGSNNTLPIEIKEDGDDLIILGIEYCDTIWANFDAETGILAIEPQLVPNKFEYEGEQYDVLFLTTTPDGEVSDEAVITLRFKLNGTAPLTNASEADGYILYSEDLGYIDGYYGLSLSPASPSPSPKRAPAHKTIHSEPKAQHHLLGVPVTDYLSFKGKYQPRLRKQSTF